MKGQHPGSPVFTPDWSWPKMDQADLRQSLLPELGEKKRNSFLLVCFETGSCYVAQVGFKLLIIMPQLSKYWDYRCVPPHSAKKYLFDHADLCEIPPVVF
jgi:hypothetical protein